MDNSNNMSYQIDPQDIIKDVNALVSLPAVCVRINEMVEDTNYSAAEIGQAISQDANLTARVLKIANSSFYSFPSRIETISRAITIIGNRELRDLVLATATIEAFDKIPIDMANMQNFWRHSIHCGVVSRLLAAKCGMLHKERMFISGLLHDVGHLVFYLKLPEIERQSMLNAAIKNQDIFIEEKKLIGFDHAYIGGELLKYWGLPDSLVEPVKFHHEPSLAKQYVLDASIVHIANLIAKHTGLGNYNIAINNLAIDALALKLTNFSDEILHTILPQAQIQVADVMSVFLPKLKSA